MTEQLGSGPVADAVARLALEKARAVAAVVKAGIVLGADTVVVIDGEALGKPADATQAREMLVRLRGRAHDVVTGLAVVDAATGRSATGAVESRVVMAAYDDEVVDRYVGGSLVVGLVGSYSNVVGLPLAETAALLRRFGVPLRPEAAI